MKAIQITQTGGPEVMSIREVPTPVPGPGELLIRVAASGVNFIDLYVREGRYANPVPFIPGQEASGTIAAVGEGVRSIKEGDRVAWCSILGTYAEFALAPADRVVPIPADISFDQAAAVMLQGMTAHYLSHSAYVPRMLHHATRSPSLRDLTPSPTAAIVPEASCPGMNGTGLA